MTAKQPSRHHSRVAVGFLFLAVVINLFDRQVMGVVAQQLKDDLQLSDAALGLLTGTAFGLFFAGVAIPAGYLADRINRGRLISLMVAIWSLSTLCCGFATNYATLLIARMGIGLGEGGAQPASAALVSDLSHPAWRSTALSLMLLGVPLGLMLGYVVGGYSAENLGWQNSFVIAGLPGLLLAALILLFVRDPRRTGLADNPVSLHSSRAAIGAVLSTPGVKVLCIGMSASSFDAYVTNAWIPSFFMRAHGMTVSEIGLVGALSVGIGGSLGVGLAGPVCDRMRKRWTSPEGWLMLFTTSLGAPWLIVMTLASDKTVALVAMCLFQVTAFAWLGPTARLIQDTAGPTHHGLAVAICTAVATVFTLIIGIPAVGAVSDLIGSIAGARSIGFALCLLAVPMAVVGVAAYRRILLRFSD